MRKDDVHNDIRIFTPDLVWLKVHDYYIWSALDFIQKIGIAQTLIVGMASLPHYSKSIENKYSLSYNIQIKYIEVGFVQAMGFR